jgi:AcrR family transcriptional regulator
MVVAYWIVGSTIQPMPRPAKHEEKSILSAAAALVAAKGPAAATVGAIGHAIGAPSGSIYHRFRSRDALLGRLWLMKASYFQSRWARALDQSDARQAGLDAALSLPQAAREDFEGARIMLLHRREDFLSEGWPPEMKAEAERLGAQVLECLGLITRRLFGRNTAAARQVTLFATLDLPFSAVRRYVATGESPPKRLDALIETAYTAIISDPSNAAGG